MPYNTSAIPPRKEVTGQAQLPLSRVKKIIAQDQDIHMCSNNAAFIITLATEMFVQYLAEEGLNMAKLDRKPRRNIQYKDIANAVSHKDNLEFLTDMVPKTVPFKQIKAQAAAARAQLSGERAIQEGGGGGPEADDAAAVEPQQEQQAPMPNGKKHKTKGAGANNRLSANGPNVAELLSGSAAAAAAARSAIEDDAGDDPNDQLRSEAQQANADRDVDMTG